MGKVKILGIDGSPRKNGNTRKMVDKALEGAMSVPGVETELYDFTGKDFHYCDGCYRCLKLGECNHQDDLQDFAEVYQAADGIIWGAPVYHMSIPASMKAALDRLGNLMAVHGARQGKDLPRFSKVCGVVTNGASRFGGQEMVLNYMVSSSLLMNGVVVAGDPMKESYIGAAAFAGGENPIHKKNILNDKTGLMMAESVGHRVAEMTRIVRAGIDALVDELPKEYFEKMELI